MLEQRRPKSEEHVGPFVTADSPVKPEPAEDDLVSPNRVRSEE